jgi:AraC-like DNA-binding protein
MRQTTQDPMLAKGLLNKEHGNQAFRLKLFAPHPDLQPWIEYYWAVEWDLGEKTFVQTVITNPTIDLSFENDQATNARAACLVITGVTPRSYRRVLRGHGDVFAVHFHPGMFRPWWGASIRALTGRAEHVQAQDRSWQVAALQVLPTLMASSNDERVRLIDAVLLQHRPEPDLLAEEIRDLVRAARHDRTLWETKLLALRRGVSLRTNQRQFLEYVGVHPKWVSQRYRVQAAIDVLDEARLGSGEAGDLTQLALELGYYDSAHFSRDFRTVTGFSPDRYRKQQP